MPLNKTLRAAGAGLALAVALPLSAQALTADQVGWCSTRNVEHSRDCEVGFGVVDTDDSFGLDGWEHILTGEIDDDEGKYVFEEGDLKLTVNVKDDDDMSGTWKIKGASEFDALMFTLRPADDDFDFGDDDFDDMSFFYTGYLIPTDKDNLSGKWSLPWYLDDVDEFHWSIYGVNLPVSEVPLPATGLLLLGGVGAMAFAARRRKS